MRRLWEAGHGCMCHWGLQQQLLFNSYVKALIWLVVALFCLGVYGLFASFFLVQLFPLFEKSSIFLPLVSSCSHSLGGAVAQLCTIHLLQRLPPSQHDSVACFGFATPALANEALATMVENKGWNSRIRNYLVPGESMIPQKAVGGPRMLCAYLVRVEHAPHRRQNQRNSCSTLVYSLS